MASREVSELVRYVKRYANVVPVASGSSHVQFRRPDGGLVRSPEGRPVTLPASPSDRRWRKNAICDLRKAGLIDRDPKGKH